ncbi:dipeptidase [Nitrosomonas sp. Nm166]|uniref:dipeptidase n=1 Tax=Nitrosomonas sp. Nm166 TaxID=1881054 RepID=UPI0008ED17C9|nr:dipeptidase [Nitrosomonas sp. Nm166]SFD98702.1 Acetylornithine deacetylase/Succinyl-diaminopimelate desuccinylase [Nitrosomonas sp. Nm166]
MRSYHTANDWVSATALSAENGALAYVSAKRTRFVSELKEFIRFPSVSAQPEHAGDLKRCAAWLAEHLQRIGMERVAVVPTDSHPIVYAESCHAPWRPTVLIYGHYDVQPAAPLIKWRSPPFKPVMRGNDLYGRGASDDKGQLFTHVKALEAFLQTNGELPVNVKCLFEGEEEIGSPHLPAFVAANPHVLNADCAVISDTQIPAPDRPAITYALRGALNLELEVLGQKRELHSGVLGGVVHNPLQALCEIIAQLHDTNGRVNIPGFYDRIRRWDAKERAYMSKVGPSDAQMLRDAAATTGWGERGYTLYERATIRPAITVSGVMGGYQGTGIKAAIPTRALAKLDFRLVPDQDPQEIDDLFRQYIAKITPASVKTRIRTLMSAKSALIDRSHPAIAAAARAYQQGFGTPPVFLRNGGTIPVVNLIQETLEIPVVMMGFGLPDDRIHGPNEKFHLPNFFKGIEASIRFLSEISKWQGNVSA